MVVFGVNGEKAEKRSGGDEAAGHCGSQRRRGKNLVRIRQKMGTCVSRREK